MKQALVTPSNAVPRKRAGMGYWLVALAIGFVAITAYWTTAKLVYTSQWTNHTHEVLEQLASVSSLVKDVQRGVRGYVITGQDQFLQPYREARTGLELKLAQLNRMTLGEPARQEQLFTFLPAIVALLDEFQGMVDLRRAHGFELSAQKVEEAHGEGLMALIDRQIESWQAQEKSALSRSVFLNGVMAAIAKFAVALAGLAAVLRFGLAGFLFQRGQRQQLREAAALRRSEERFRVLVENLPDRSVIMLGLGGHIMNWNAAAERMTGHRENEIIGRHFACLYAGAGEPEPVGEWLAGAAAAGRYEGEAWCLRKNGQRFRVHEVITAVREDDGQITGFIRITSEAPAARTSMEAPVWASSPAPAASPALVATPA